MVRETFKSDQNPWKALIKDIIFSKVAGFQLISLLKMNSFTGIFKDFAVQILSWKIKFWSFHNSEIYETDMLLEFCKTTRSICKKSISFQSHFYWQKCRDKRGMFAPPPPIRLATRLQKNNLLEKHVFSYQIINKHWSIMSKNDNKKVLFSSQ